LVHLPRVLLGSWSNACASIAIDWVDYSLSKGLIDEVLESQDGVLKANWIDEL
jgi:hypothetical protein